MILEFKVLWVRSFAAKNYANDLAQRAILELSNRPIFTQLSFTIRGDGALFEEITRPLKQFDNISIEQQFLSVERLAALHKDHGVMLTPTRWDSQGLTLGEAMSSGLAVVSNSVAAIPEFVDEKTGMLSAAEDYVGLADSIEELALNPTLFQAISAAAAKRAQKQCGYDATLKAELRLLKKAGAVATL